MRSPRSHISAKAGLRHESQESSPRVYGPLDWAFSSDDVLPILNEHLASSYSPVAVLVTKNTVCGCLDDVVS